MLHWFFVYNTSKARITEEYVTHRQFELSTIGSDRGLFYRYYAISNLDTTSQSALEGKRVASIIEE